jgi:DNA topoisomerase IA
MQQEASNKLGFSPKRTMQIAQKSYEGIEINNYISLTAKIRVNHPFSDTTKNTGSC